MNRLVPLIALATALVACVGEADSTTTTTTGLQTTTTTTSAITTTTVSTTSSTTPTSTSSVVADELSIVGDAEFVDHTEEALDLLAASAPLAHNQVYDHIDTIRAVTEGSGMDVFTQTFLVGEATAYAPGFSNAEQVVWYASAIVHDSCHSRQYTEGKAYTGKEAELECLGDQLGALQSLGTSSYFEEYVDGLIEGADDPGNDYWNDPDRHW